MTTDHERARAEVRRVIERYHQCWLESDRAGARALLADDVTFRSAAESVDGADALLDACWGRAAEFDAIEVEHAVYDDRAGYVVYSGASYCCGELFYVANGTIRAIYATSDPAR